MKKIKRKGFPSILKEKIDLKNIIDYKDLNLEVITNILNEVINSYVYSTIDLLELLRIHYNGDFMGTIASIQDYSKVRFNCYYATTLLKEKLKSVEIDSKIISFQSIGFSSPFGDSLIKEAHMALLIPTRRRNKVYYILLDPGLRIPAPIGFFKNKRKSCCRIDQDWIAIRKEKNLEYPYSMEIKGYNRYSIKKKYYKCKEYFNVNYETVNPLDILFPISYYLLDGYRIIRYPLKKENFASIKIMILQKYLECSDCNGNVRIGLEEWNPMSHKQLVNVLKKYTDKLDTKVEDLIKTIYFVFNHQEEFVSILHEKMLEEKLELK